MVNNNKSDRQKVECIIKEFQAWPDCQDYINEDYITDCIYYRKDKEYTNGICLLNEIREFNKREMRLEDELFEI